MSKGASGFSSLQLRLLFRLIPEAERSTALNLRSHNPVDVKMVTEGQVYVDEALGIKGNTFFKSGDETRVAALKGIRNLLAGRVKKNWISRWFFTGADEGALESLRVYLEGLLASPKARFLRVRGVPKFPVMGLLLLAKRLKRAAEAAGGAFSTERGLPARGLLSGGKEPREATAEDTNKAKRPTVLVLTSLFHEIVSFTVRRVVAELRRKNVRLVLAFHDGSDPEKLRSGEKKLWCAGMSCVALEQNRGFFSSCAALIAAPHLILPAIGSITFAFRRVIRSAPEDWESKWLLLRKIPALIIGFHVSLLHAGHILSRYRPASVFSCDNGSENLHVKAFAYLCLRKGIRFYRYKPVPAFPVRQPVFNSVSRFMLAAPDDAEIFRDNGSAPEVWHVGSPILDLAAPFIPNNARAAAERDGKERERIRILFFTKRDFPNRGVISAVSEYCEENLLPVKVIVKFHPSDAKQFDLGRSNSDDFVKVVCYGKEEIDQVDRLIFESDIVISGSSNVIWSAFAQFKPVLYLAFKGMSSEEHLSGYRRYATSDFIAVSALNQIGPAVGELIKRARAGKMAKHSAQHDSLMRNFFCNGEFNSTDRICQILLGDPCTNR